MCRTSYLSMLWRRLCIEILGMIVYVRIPIRKFIFSFSYMFIQWAYFMLCKRSPHNQCSSSQHKKEAQIENKQYSNESSTEEEKESKSERNCTNIVLSMAQKGYNLLVNIILWNVASIFIERPRIALFQHATISSCSCCCCCRSIAWSHFHIAHELWLVFLHTHKSSRCIVAWWWRW